MSAITLLDLDAASATFRSVEKRACFYDMALGLLRTGHELEGCVLLLATWNSGRFRFIGANFDVDALRDALSKVSADFEALAEYSIQSIDITAHSASIARIFEALAAIPGVEYTGATKLMSLRNPKLFVMWDDYIRGSRPKMRYKALPCVVSGKWSLRTYPTTGLGYVSFLSDVQTKFRTMSYPAGSKTLAKAIDEFHYINITLVIQVIEDDIERAREQAKTAAEAKK
jgi:hypothetical protein